MTRPRAHGQLFISQQQQSLDATGIVTPRLTPMTCPRCGTVALPLISPGKGPHALRATCPSCGRYLGWLSVRSPEDKARRQAAAMQAQPATPGQLHYLRDILRDRGPQPANKWDASQRIDTLKNQKERLL